MSISIIRISWSAAGAKFYSLGVSFFFYFPWSLSVTSTGKLCGPERVLSNSENSSDDEMSLNDCSNLNADWLDAILSTVWHIAMFTVRLNADKNRNNFGGLRHADVEIIHKIASNEAIHIVINSLISFKNSQHTPRFTAYNKSKVRPTRKTKHVYTCPK